MAGLSRMFQALRNIRKNRKHIFSRSEKRSEEFESGAIHTLSLLQRESGLIDFLMDNIDVYEDAQVGAVVRRIHDRCRRVLKNNYQVQPVIDRPAGTVYNVDDNLDPSRIRMVGDVPDMTPFDGVIRHPGWEAGALDLPDCDSLSGNKVILRAEIRF